MKIFYFIFAFVLMTGSSQATDTLPTEFLGMWEPMSRTSLDIGLKIEGNKITHIQNSAFLCCHHRDKPKIVQTDEFKILDVPTPPHQIYLLFKQQEKGKLPEYRYISLRVKNNNYNSGKTLYFAVLDLDKQQRSEWDNPNIVRFEKWLQNIPDCTNCAIRELYTYSQ